MKNILVIGASGFVGRHLAKELLANGYSVSCLVRNPVKVQDLANVGCKIVKGDILDEVSIQNALSSIDAVYISIHTLSAQAANSEAKDFTDAEFIGLQNIVAACRAKNVRRVIDVTFLGTSPDAPSSWIRGRWKTEQFLLSSGLDVTIIRPGMIVGIGGQGYNSVVSNAKKKFAIVLGNGSQKFIAIAVPDLIYYLIGILNDSRSFKQSYDVGNDEILTIPQMIDIVADIIGHSHPRKIHIPLSLLSLSSPLIERISKMPKGSIKGLAESIKTDAIGNPEPIRKILPRSLLSFRQASELVLTDAQKTKQ